MNEADGIYGLLAEFKDADALVDATSRATAAGYRKVDAYAPFSVPGLADALGFRRDRVALITLLGGIAGGVARRGSARPPCGPAW